MITFLISVVLLWKMDVEKYLDEDRMKIRESRERAEQAAGEREERT